ncbi:MAG: hypothetical protein JNK87_08445, partial [Bryobacterales bacterium]|nr:hypothetical protein [Bryobacterales bacterium]
MQKLVLPVLGLLWATLSPAQQFLISTIAGNGTRAYSGDGGPATDAAIRFPRGVAVDAAGNLYISDTGNHRIRKVAPNGIITTYAGTGVSGFSGDGGPATLARLNEPDSMVTDAAGNLYFSDYGNRRIRKIDTSGVITTVAGNGTDEKSGDGILATSSGTSNSTGIDLDHLGNLYIAGRWIGEQRVRKVSPGPFGVITTIAGTTTGTGTGDGTTATTSFTEPSGVGVDRAGTVYIAEERCAIRTVDATGIIRRFAGDYDPLRGAGDGSLALQAQVCPTDIRVAINGAVYVADHYFNRVRRINPNGIIESVAGSSAGFSGDGGPAAGARLDNPQGLAIDSLGNLYVADRDNHRIRKLTRAATYTLSSPSQIFSAVGGTGSVGVTVNPTGVPWNAFSLADWV